MEELSKVILEKENSKLIFEEKKDSLEINFFSVVDNPVFEISSENEDVYNSFKSFVSSINKGNKNLLDEEILDTVIYSEDETAGISMLSINITEESVSLEFSSPFHTNILLTKSDKEEIKLMIILFETLRTINASYYQTYLNEYFTSGRELKLELK